MRRFIWIVLALTVGACSALEPTFKAEPETDETTVTVEVTFDGRSALGRATLLRVIEDQMLDLSRRPDSEAPVFDAGLDLADYYRNQGYPDVTVEYRQPKRSADGSTLQVTFDVSEGPRVVVDPMTIVGNASIDTEVLLPLWQRRLSDALGFGDPLFVASDLAAFREAIRNTYWSEGYLEVEVAEPKTERTDNKAAVTITIEEGPQYTIDRIDVPDEIIAAIGPAAPEQPDGPAMTSSFRRYELAVRAALRRRGYPDPEVVLAARADRSDKTVDLRLRGKTGNKAVIAEIEIVGNTNTKEAFIRQRLGMKTDVYYDGKTEEDGVERLYRTGLFRKVQVRHEWLDDDRIKEVIELEEVDSRRADLLLGYGSYEQFRTGLRFEERNLFGTGKDLLVEGKLSERGHRVRGTLTDPAIFGSDMTLSISGELFRREEPSFTDRAASGTIALSTSLARNLRGRLGYTIANRFDTSADVAGVLSDYREGRVFTELNFDRRDNPLYPKSGEQAFASFESMAPAFGADVEFLRAKLGFTLHLPIWAETRIVLHSQQRWIWPGEGSDRIPIQERFFLGGENSIRSFREARASPRDAANQLVGGEYSNFFGTELRVPIWRALEAAAFAEMGNVGSDVRDYGLSDLDYAVGVGLRLVLPIGPIRVDAAHNPDEEPGESDWVVHFSVGYPF